MKIIKNFIPLVFFLYLGLPNSISAASKDVGFFDLNNTNTVVLIAFVLFVLLLIYLKVPKIIGGALDGRVDIVNKQTERAIAVKDESVELLAAIKRKETKAIENAEKIVSDARAASKHDLEQIETYISGMVSRKLKAAEDQITMAENAAVKKISHMSSEIAVEVASGYLVGDLSKANHDELIGSAISSLSKDLKGIAFRSNS